MTPFLNLFLLSFILVALVILIISVGRRWVPVGKKWLENRQATVTKEYTTNESGHFGKSRVVPKPGFFDIGFTRFISNTWVSIIWVIDIIVACIVAVVGCVAGLVIGVNSEPAAFLLVLAAPLGAVLWLLLSRMSLELAIVLFRIESHLRAMREKSEEQRR